MEIVRKYFPNLTPVQLKQFGQLQPLYADWNEKINVISRKDIDNLYLHHVLHSLSIGRIVSFKPGTKILDIGTGGGFPGIPLAILFPEVDFHLVDSIGKKIKVVQAVTEALDLKNVKSEQARGEELKGQYDFVVARAVTNINSLYHWTRNKIKQNSRHKLKNGLLALKGGDLKDELAQLSKKHTAFNIHEFFPEDYFKGKWVVKVSN